MRTRLLNKHHTLLAFAVFVCLLIIYVLTLMPGTVGGDAGELQYAAPLLALVHPTGQPLYVILGKIWTSIIPFGDAAYRMNLLSAVSAAAGCGLTGWFIAHIYGSVWIGAAAGLTLGLGTTVWGQAVIADKYGFNVLLASLIVGVALWWDHTYEHNSQQSTHLLYTLSAVFGIALLHHRSLALFAPGIVILMIVRLRMDLWRRWQRTLICAALVALPSFFIYPTVLPWLQSRELSPLLWQPHTPGEWVDFMLERHVLETEALVFDDLGSIIDQLKIYGETTFTDYTPLVLVGGVVGMGVMIQRYPGGAFFLIISYVLEAVLSANFRGNDRQFTYYLPSFVTLIYGYGYVLWWFTQRGWRELALLGSAGILISQFAGTFPDYRDHALYGESLGLWRQTMKTGDMGIRLTSHLDRLPPNVVLAADWEQITILWYEQQVEGQRPDLEIVYPIERYADYQERPVCLARHVPVDANWHPTNIGALICLNAEPITNLPEYITPIGTALMDAAGKPILELAGYELEAKPYNAGAHVPLVMTWRALTDVPHDYSVSLHLLDEAWNTAWSRDIQSPVMGMYATSHWVEGEVVQDYHEIDIPRDLPSGHYLWTVVIYRQLEDGTFEHLRDADNHVNILGGTLAVES